MDFSLSNFLSGLWGEPYDWVKWVHRNLSDNHCPECLMLDGCFFKGDNHPPHPHHSFCHCVLENISQNEVKSQATTFAAYQKFDPYLFDPEDFYKHGKNKAFESWGYSINDSNWLKNEFEKQALQKYILGDYKLGKLDEHGQRLSIEIKIPRKDKEGSVSFTTGWMVCPNGKIKLNTPLGGK